MTRFKYHLFVCTNQRAPGSRPACGTAGQALADALLETIARRPELRSQVAVTPCGCLGPCFDGPMIVAYPKGRWYAGVSQQDVEELLESLRANRPLARLDYDWSSEDEA